MPDRLGRFGGLGGLEAWRLRHLEHMQAADQPTHHCGKRGKIGQSLTTPPMSSQGKHLPLHSMAWAKIRPFEWMKTVDYA